MRKENGKRESPYKGILKFADEKNAFDIEAFLSTRLKLKPNEVYDVYEVDAEGA